MVRSAQTLFYGRLHFGSTNYLTFFSHNFSCYILSKNQFIIKLGKINMKQNHENKFEIKTIRAHSPKQIIIPPGRQKSKIIQHNV